MLLLGLLLPAGSESANAADDVFGDLFRAIGRAIAPERPEAAPVQVVPKFEEIEAAPGVLNQFTPHLKKVLTVELHFVKKVCQPSDEQFEIIHRSGIDAVGRASVLLQKIEQARQRPLWPDPHELITKALLKTVKEVGSDEAAEEYERELKHRKQARRQAGVNAVVLTLDEEVNLSAEQFAPVAERIEQNWQPEWQNVARMMTYSQYVALPEPRKLKPVLSNLQYEILKRLPPRASVRFGWQTELGFQTFLGGQDLPPFEVPDGIEEEPAVAAKQVERAMVEVEVVEEMIPAPREND